MAEPAEPAQGIGASGDAIRRHYDVSNEFHGLWLDPTRTYSAALWEPGDALDAAQVRKLDYHAVQAKAVGGARVLDVGCGWGSMLRRLVGVHGVAHVVGLTLSERQLEWIRACPDPRLDVRLEHWADHLPAAPYDAIVSIGAFEHFARRHLPPAEKLAGYRRFFECCHRWLRPGGGLSLQTVVYENSGPEDFSEFFAREVFPESDLPRLADVLAASARLFEVVTVRNDREHYARTFRAWSRALTLRYDEAVRVVGEPVVERYLLFFRVAIHGFQTATMNLSRVTFARLDHPRAERPAAR
jgi:cyclopropane-fatty-acyl-phospholipid synthase